MSDKYTLGLKNFRSIREAEIDIAPLTVVYGPNGSGKSSLIYGLLTLKNFLTEPDRNLPGLFSYPGISLGGFDEVVLDHREEQEILMSLGTNERTLTENFDVEEHVSKFSMEAAKSGGKLKMSFDGPPLARPTEIELEIPFPYQTDQYTYGDCLVQWGRPDEGFPAIAFDIKWDGINLNLGHIENDWLQEDAAQFLRWADSPLKLLTGTYFVPLWRGFMLPQYDDVYEINMLSSDAEVAAMVADLRNLEYEVSRYMEQVTGRQFRTRMQRGSSTFNIDAIPNSRDAPSSIVNDGFGVNQVAYMLTVALYDKAKVVLVEEPEIHLHPSMVRKLVHALVDIALDKEKRFVISTHSETFVVALLAQIAAEKIGVDDVSFILAQKENGESKFTKQEAKPNGQIQGGLESFIAAELEDMAAFLGLDPEEDLD